MSARRPHRKHIAFLEREQHQVPPHIWDKLEQPPSAVEDCEAMKQRNTAWVRRATDKIDSLPWQDAPTTPLVNFAGALTPTGEEVRLWMESCGITIPDVPAEKGSLIKPAARWFATLTALETDALVARYQMAVAAKATTDDV